MNERYLDIPGYEGYYQASNHGNIKSVRNDKILAQSVNNNGYMLVSISVNGKHEMKTVHRLVAKAFISNPKGYRDVNHIDGNKKNNKSENLEWVKHSDNIKHSYHVLKQKRNNVKVRCVDTQREYESIREASIQTGINVSSIGHAINGISQTAGGLKWERY